MKYQQSFMTLLLTMIVINIINITNVQSVKLQLRAPPKKETADEDLISDKELDALLKDPKYASLASGLTDPTLEAASKSVSLTDSKPSQASKGHSSSSAGSHYMSSSYKDHLDRMKNGKSKSNAKTSKADPLESMNLLDKSLSSDPLKELDLLGGAGASAPKTEDKPKDKKAEAEEKFKNFDFISKQQARYLIEVLKQPVFFNMLPAEAQQIVKVTNNSPILIIFKNIIFYIFEPGNK